MYEKNSEKLKSYLDNHSHTAITKVNQSCDSYTNEREGADSKTAENISTVEQYVSISSWKFLPISSHFPFSPPPLPPHHT